MGVKVDNVIINGKLIISNKKFENIDETEIIKDSNRRAQRIFELASEDWIQANSKLVKDTSNGWF